MTRHRQKQYTQHKIDPHTIDRAMQSDRSIPSWPDQRTMALYIETSWSPYEYLLPDIYSRSNRIYCAASNRVLRILYVCPK